MVDVPSPYLINDTRKPELFKKTTFSNFLKKDVFQTLFKKIDGGNASEVCLWSTECVISGYLDELWEKSLEYYVKYININSPLIPYHLFQKLVLFLRLKKQEHFAKNPMDLRNCQEVRNHIAEIMCLLTHATKSRKCITLPKIKQQDFESSYFQDNLIAEHKIPNSTLVSNIINPKDPPELKSISYTFYYYLTHKHYNLKKCIYWLFWVIEWEKLMILKFGHYSCYSRHQLVNVEQKISQDMIWIFWCLVLKECETRYDNMISKQIKSLFEFFKFKYTSSKKRKRIFYLINSIQLLDPKLEVNYEKYPIFENYPITLQACANINIVYQHYKNEETVSKNYMNSKSKLEATYVVTKHEDITQLDSLSQYRLKLKEDKQRQKEYKEFQSKQKLDKRKNKEQRQAQKKYMLETIDNHIINSSHQREIPIKHIMSNIQDTDKKIKSTSPSQKTIHIMDKIDDRLKLGAQSGKNKNKKKLDKNNYLFQVIKTD